MAIQTINLGTYANDGTGDDLRTAFQKVNANLTELYSALYGANIGATPPVSGVGEGELWWSTVEGKLYVYYGTAWIEASPAGTSTSYSLSAESTTNGANLRLSSSESTIDDVKFASGTNITVTRTDANTITLSSTSYTGNVTGNVSGTVTGALIGNVTGNVTGEVFGNVNGTVSNISNHNLADLGDVSSTEPATGQGLVWNGSIWTPGTVSSSGGDLDFGTFGTPAGFTLDLGTF